MTRSSSEGRQQFQRSENAPPDPSTHHLPAKPSLRAGGALRERVPGFLRCPWLPGVAMPPLRLTRDLGLNAGAGIEVHGNGERETAVEQEAETRAPQKGRYLGGGEC